MRSTDRPCIPGCRRRVLALGLAAFGAARSAASQPATPPGAAQPTRMVCPAPPGSAPDLAARLLADGLSRRRGHPIAVDNRAGADGAIAAEAFARMIPRGEALFFTWGGVLTVTPLMNERVGYDPWSDFVPVSTGADDLFAVSTAPDLPAGTLQDLVAHARERAGALNWYASSGEPWLTFRAFLRSAGLDMAYVSYRGAPAALLDLAAGRIQVALTPLAPALPLARERRIRLLAATTRERAPAVPDLPTTAEAGMPDFQLEGLLGLFGWRGMPEALRAEFSAQARATLAEPATAERLRAAGMAARGSTPAEYTAELAAHRAHWAALVREFGANPAG